jgi:protein involved in polysaccharide export with SLBB domain
MTKALIKSALALALLLCAVGVEAQRVGPIEDDAASSEGAKTASEKAKESKPDAKAEAKKTDVKSSTDPKPATDIKPSAKTETRAQPLEEKRDHSGASTTNSPGTSNTPNATNGSASTIPVGERAASAVPPAKSDALPDATPTPAPLQGSPTVGVPPAPPKYEPPQPIKAEVPANNSTSNTNASANANASSALSPTAIYRVGAGDILDIRLVGGMSKDYTLFTVLSNGTIDYPLAGEPVFVLNLTPEEIGARLSAALKRRGIFDRAQFQISVRDFTSHTVLVSGLVEQPGQKTLRREAVPLYVVLAEAFPRADAGRVVIISRATGGTKTVDLSDSGALNELVQSGDVINVQPRPQEFYYIAGQVGAPGQKDYHQGLTLTQAILAAGGLTREAGKKTIVTVSRQGADGRLVPADYALQEIQDGKAPDPRVQPGDRIEVGRHR